MKFSVLMSIYKNEQVNFFVRCMQSIWDEQTVKPAEIILVIDGPLYDELYQAIDVWRDKLGELFNVIPLEYNLGLGNALNIGLSHCSNELVARMDTDDISLPDRFEKQLAVFQKTNTDICGSWVSEFDRNELSIESYRKLPEDHETIVKFSKKRNPLNHPTVMYKKSMVELVGSYGKYRFAQDYHLWALLILHGAKFYNIQEPLVNMRAGYALLERRGGVKYAINEFNIQKEFLRIKFISKTQFCSNVILRFSVRLLPSMFLRSIYQKIRASSI